MTDVCVSPAREAEVLGVASGPAGAAPVALPEGALVCEAAPAEQVCRSESERRACLLAPEATSRPPETAAGAALRERPDVRPDELVGAVLIEHVMEQLGLPGTEQLRLDLLMAFDAARRRALPAYPGARFGPENPYPDDVLTRTLRDAIGYSAAGPPTLAEAERLAAFALSGLTELLGISADQLREVAGLGGRALTLEEDTDATDPLLALFETVWDEPDTEDEATPWEDRSDPPADDPLPGQLRQGALKVHQAGTPLRAVPIAVLGALGPGRLRRLMKLALPWKLRSQAGEYAESKASLPANTSNDGLVAEAAIRVAYEAYAVGRTPLFGTRVGGATLGAAAAQNPLWNVVGTGLISFLSGRVGAPDILDLELGHVYEIKPMRRAVDGAKQLYGRYLFWLNLAEIAAANATGFSVLEIAVWAARACRGEPAPPFPLGTRAFTAPKRVWTPGPWKPPPGLPLADGRWLVI